jgi:phage FluMu protein Com
MKHGGIRKVVQVGLTPLRCQNCNALLLQASSGSVVSVVCGRCGTHTIAEIPTSDKLVVDKSRIPPQVIGTRAQPATRG